MCNKAHVCGVNNTTLIKCMQYDETNEKYFMSGYWRTNINVVHTHQSSPHKIGENTFC